MWQHACVSWCRRYTKHWLRRDLVAKAKALIPSGGPAMCKPCRRCAIGLGGGIASSMMRVAELRCEALRCLWRVACCACIIGWLSCPKAMGTSKVAWLSKCVAMLRITWHLRSNAMMPLRRLMLQRLML